MVGEFKNTTSVTPREEKLPQEKQLFANLIQAINKLPPVSKESFYNAVSFTLTAEQTVKLKKLLESNIR